MFCLAWHVGWKALVAEMAVDSVAGLCGRPLVGAQSLFDGWDQAELQSTFYSNEFL